MNILEGALLFAVMAKEVEAAEKHALAEAARIIMEESKAELGTYQGAAGPTAAWAPLAESTKEDRVKHGYSEDEPLLRDGTLRDSIEMTVEPKDAYIGTADVRGVYLEEGTARIPPRSFLVGAAYRKEDEIHKKFEEIIIKHL